MISEITTMELYAIREALTLSLDEFEAAEDDGHVLTTGAREAIDEALVIVNSLIRKENKAEIGKICINYEDNNS